MTKTTHTTTPSKTSHKSRMPKNGDYWPYLGKWSKKGKAQKLYVDNLVERLFKFGDDSGSLKMAQFWVAERIPRRSYYDLLAVYPDLATAHEHVITQIGNRRELGAIKGYFKEKTVAHVQHNYDKDWGDANIYHADLAAKSREKVPQGDITVVIQAAEDTGLKMMKKNAEVLKEQKEKEEIDG